MNVQVELAPHTGIQEVDTGKGIKRFQYTHQDQWMVYFTAEDITRKFIGYLPKKIGAPFLPYTTFMLQPLGLQELIAEAISKAAGDPRPVGIAPLPPEMLEPATEEPEEDEDEEDDIGELE